MHVSKLPWVVRALLLNAFGARIGAFSYIGPPCYLAGISRVRIGRRFRCFPGLRLEVGPSGRFTVEDDVGIAQNAHIICGSSVKVGCGSRIGPNVTISDTQHVFGLAPGAAFQSKDDIIKGVIIGENTFIGANAVIDLGTVIGKGCVVAANSYVRGKFDDQMLIAGNPATPVRKT